MAEVSIHDVSYENATLANAVAGAVLVQDIPNTTNVRRCATLPAAAGAQPIGVAMEPSQVDASGAVRANAGWLVRIWGVATCVASAAIAVGDKVAIANASGQVATQARAAAGVQPVPIVGIAQTATTAGGQGVEVLLSIGSTW